MNLAMKFQPKRRILLGLLGCGMALGVAAGPARASSELIQGQFVQTNPAGQSFDGPGVCRFITGPRDDLAAGRFVLTAGDHEDPNSAAVRLTGLYSATSTRAGEVFTLYPEKERAERYVEEVLRKQLADKWVVFHLQTLDVSVRQALPDRLLCNVSLTGRLTGGNLRATDVSMSFTHRGLYDPGPAEQTAALASAGVATATQNVANQCPIEELAPLGLAPVPAQCTNPNTCMVDFKGYKWWTSFQYYGDGKYFPGGGYFYNGGLQTAFAPRNILVDAAGLHLKIAKQDLGGGPTVAGSEAVLMFHSDNSEANLGYGDYLVTAKINSAPSWAMLDPNASFGVFTFERIGTGSTGPTTNPHREIDLAEISRWGWDHTGDCPFKGDEAPMCEGNAQFTLQPWETRQKNLHRYTIKGGVATITLVMRWHGAAQPVSFEQYNGAFDFANLPAKADYDWTSAATQNEFVPATKCERFHLNFWLGNYKHPPGPNPPPQSLPQEIVVTNFTFKPFP